MNFDALERARFYVGQNVRKAKIAAQTARLNGYIAVALEQENEAALGDLVLKDLAQEKTDAR